MNPKEDYFSYPKTIGSISRNGHFSEAAKEVRAPLLGLYSPSMLQCCVLNILRRPQKDVCLLEANGTNPLDVSLTVSNRLLVEAKRKPCCMYLFVSFPFEPERLRFSTMLYLLC
jgi:hypothetical protein